MKEEDLEEGGKVGLADLECDGGSGVAVGNLQLGLQEVLGGLDSEDDGAGLLADFEPVPLAFREGLAEVADLLRAVAQAVAVQEVQSEPERWDHLELVE